MKEKLIITVSREYGSGGREIGEKVANALGIPYYDKKIIDLAAKETGFHADFIESEEHKVTNSFLFNIATGGYMLGGMSTGMPLSLSDQIFNAECEIIKKVASEGSCVIVGRCADYILKDNFDCLNIFIHADIEYRRARIAKEYNITPEKAAENIKKTDKARIRHYQYYGNQSWGVAGNFDITLNSGKLGIDRCVKLIVDAVNEL